MYIPRKLHGVYYSGVASLSATIPNNEEPTYTISDVMTQLMAIKGAVEATKSSLEVTNDKLDAVDAKFDKLETKHNILDAKVTNIDNRLKLVEETHNQMIVAKQEYEQSALKAHISSLATELNNKRFNVIIDGIQKIDVIETPEASEKLVKEFLVDTLKVENGNDIVISDAHRLTVSRNYNGQRPPALIFKLVRLLDKRTIAKSLPNLKDINASLPTGKKIFVNLNHLPRELENDRKSLKVKFNDARKQKLKPTFKFNRITGQYCLHVGNVIHTPIRDNSAVSITSPSSSTNAWSAPK